MTKPTTSAKVLANWLSYKQWLALKSELRDMRDCLISVEFTDIGFRILGDMDGIEANALLEDMRDRDGTK